MECTSNVWAMGKQGGLVSIGTHALFLHATGPDRKPGEAVVIIIQGLACGIKGWAAVTRGLRPFIRTYSYDRAGYGQSDASPQEPTAITIAGELDLLLQNANIAPPYILVAHSWGGILSREFINLRGSNDVAGLVLVDANHERMLQVADWRDLARSPVVEGLREIPGLERDRKLTDAEWREYLDEETSEKHMKQAEAERVEYPKSFPVLALKNQLHKTPPLLGDRPVYVVMGHTKLDFDKLYEAGVKMGNGTEEERVVFRENLRTWDERDRPLLLEQLSLSSNSRFSIAEESGHFVHLTQPDIIVDAVKWVVGEFQNRIL